MVGVTKTNMILLDAVFVNIIDGVEVCSLLEMLLIEATNDVVFSLLVNVTLVDVTDDEDINSLLDNVLVGITDVVVVEVSSLVNITLVDLTDVTLVNVPGGIKVPSMLETRLVEETNDEEVCLEDMIDFIRVSSLLDAALVDATDDSSVVDISLLDVSDGMSLLDATLVATVTDVPVLITTTVEVIYCTEVSILFDVTLALNVVDSGVNCSLLNVVMIEVTDNVEEGLLLDSSLVAVLVGIVVEINEVAINVVVGEVTYGIIAEASDIERAWSLLDIILVGKIDNKEVIPFLNVALLNVRAVAVMEGITVAAESRLVFVTIVVMTGISDNENVIDGIEACPSLDSITVGA